MGRDLGVPTDEGLPLELLQRRDEILWYQELLLWEDELGDNGLCRLTARIRVMPSFWFALLRCEIRCDGVLIRDIATRLFCETHRKPEILREWTWRETSYEDLRRRGVDITKAPEISQESIGTSLLEDSDVRRCELHKILA